MIKTTIPQNLQDWIEARKRFHLSHAQVQMARELGMNPENSGSSTITIRSAGRRPFRSSSNTST